MANPKSEKQTKPKPRMDGTFSPWPGASAVLLHLLERGARVQLAGDYWLFVYDNKLVAGAGKLISTRSGDMPDRFYGEFDTTLRGLKSAIARLHKECDRDERKKARKSATPEVSDVPNSYPQNE